MRGPTKFSSTPSPPPSVDHPNRRQQPDMEKMAEGRRPVLVKGPVDAYIVRSYPASLSCRALYAQRISFKCNDEWVFDSNHENKQGIDEHSKASFLESRILVQKREVEEYFGLSGFSCECFAYGSLDMQPDSKNFVKSQPATVRISHLRKHFEREPTSDRQPLGGTVHIPCLPPEGEPRPQVFWLKDGQEIEPRSDKNVIIAHDGSLIIAIARLTDSANYTCGAKNLANQRLSQTATITIYVDGNWSEWSHWSGACPSTCADADHLTISRQRPQPRRLRYRQCVRPAPINGGLPCSGLNDQRQECPTPCSVDGEWSDWSQWNQCQVADCQRSRVRRCQSKPSGGGGLRRYGGTAHVEPISCLGREAHEFKNCSADACSLAKLTLPSGMPPSNTLNLAMLTGLAVASLVFLFAVLFLLASLLRWRRPTTFKSSSTSSAASSTSCRRCTPCVVKNDVSDIAVITDHCKSTKSHHQCAYAALSSSDGDANPSPTPTRSLLGGGGPCGASKRRQPTATTTTTSSTLTYDAPPSLKSDRSRLALLAWPNGADVSDSGGSSPDHHYAVVEDPLEENSQTQRNLFISALLPSNFPRIWGQIGASGGRLELVDCGISLYVPEGAITQSIDPHDGSIAPSTMNFLLALCPESPRLNSQNQTFLGPSVLVHACYPGTQMGQPPALRKPLVLSMDHCASDPRQWSLTLHVEEWTDADFSVVNKKGEKGRQKKSSLWLPAVTGGKETLNSAAFLNVEQNGQCHVMMESFGRFALIGEPKISPTTPASKRIRLLTFVSDISLRVYCVPDVKASIHWALQQEDDLGGRLSADPEQCFEVRATGADLQLRLDDLRPQWRLRPGLQCQEIPRVHLWAADPSAALHCAFALESPSMANRHPTDYLSGRLTVDQKVGHGAGTTDCSNKLALDVDTSVDWPWAQRPFERQSLNLLSPTTKFELASLLNPPLDLGNDWRLLANLLSVDSYLPYFASRPSPADLILSLWEAKSRDADDLRRLIQIFYKMKREDTVQAVISGSTA